MLQVCIEYGFLSKVNVCSEYAFWLKSTSLQWIRLLIKKYRFAMNTNFGGKVQVCSAYDFCLKSNDCNEYEFCLSVQWIRLLFKKCRFAKNFGTSLQWIRLLVKRYKFAVNTPFGWEVQVCSEYDFWLKSTGLNEYEFWYKYLQWIRLLFKMYRRIRIASVNTTFHWKVQVCSEYEFC